MTQYSIIAAVAGSVLGAFLVIIVIKIRTNLKDRQLDNMEGHDFEYFCADLLKDRGFLDVQVTKGSGDYGWCGHDQSIFYKACG